MKNVRAIILAVLTTPLLCTGTLLAHPMGNFSINHHSTLRISQGHILINYLLDFAEIPTFQMFPEAQTSSADGKVRAMAEEWVRQLHLQADGVDLPFELTGVSSVASPGAGGLVTLKAQLQLAALWAGNSATIQFEDDNFPNRIGWKEIVLTAQSPEGFPDGNPFNVDRSNGLRNYPADLISTAPDVTRAIIRIGPAGSNSNSTVAQPNVTASGFLSGSIQKGDQLSQILSQATIPVRLILLGLTIAFALGAMHALSPGHGKTVVAAYLVGNRGTARHAIFLGAVVTFTHTIGVFLLGVITLFLSHYVVPEKLYPILGFLSGIMILAIGARLFRDRLHTIRANGKSHSHGDRQEHSHSHSGEPYGHSHEIPDTITLQSLLALGFSGGIIPCPSALVVLLSAVALHRIEVGLLFIVAFSLGLATILVGIGMLVVRASRFLSRFDSHRGAIRFMPVLSAAIIGVLGLGIAIQSIGGFAVVLPRSVVSVVSNGP